MSKTTLLEPGRYLIVSAITGTVINAMNLIRGSKASDPVSFNIPENCLVIRDLGVGMSRGRRVADIREISLEDKRIVAEAVEANAARAKPSEKKESKASAAPAVDLLSSGEGEVKA